MDEGQKAALIAEKLAAKGSGPVKKPSRPAAKRQAAKKQGEMPVGAPVGNSVGLACVCRTSGCSEQGVRKTFRVPALGKIALLPGGVMCLVCERGMKFDMDDVQVDRIEREG
jgi:hypothetical protein